MTLISIVQDSLFLHFDDFVWIDVLGGTGSFKNIFIDIVF